MKKFLALALTMLASSAGATSIYDCLIEPHMVVDVNSSVEGKISRIDVERSDLVERGQTLVELESEVEKATVELAQARVRMDAEYQTRQVSRDFAKRKLVRFDDLYHEDVVSLQKQDEVKTEAVLAGLQLEQEREKREVAELELKRAIAILDQRTVKSPINGIVVDRFKSPGEFVEDEPILRLAQLNPLNVEVILPASMFGTITTGMQASVVPEAPRNNTYMARVTIVDRIVDASSGTFGVRLELQNPDYALPGGLKCMVEFPLVSGPRQSGGDSPGYGPAADRISIR
jgi:RND family efflux transporter MFP subunit